MRSRSLATIGSLAFLGSALLVETSVAQNNKNKNQQPRETVSKGLSERQKKRNEEKNASVRRARRSSACT